MSQLYWLKQIFWSPEHMLKQNFRELSLSLIVRIPQLNSCNFGYIFRISKRKYIFMCVNRI